MKKDDSESGLADGFALSSLVGSQTNAGKNSMSMAEFKLNLGEAH
jgi:hypothetical protein